MIFVDGWGERKRRITSRRSSEIHSQRREEIEMSAEIIVGPMKKSAPSDSSLSSNSL